MIYRIFTFCILIFLAVSSCGRTQDKADDIKQINNTKGDKHVKIAGTNVYIIPPEGFLMTATEEGVFDPSSGARITVTQRHRSFNGQLNKPELTEHLIDQHLVRVNQYQGYYQSIREGEAFLREVLTFGNDNVTVTLIAEIPSRNSEIINKVRAAMQSVVLLDEKLPDPSDDAIFKVDINNTNLKFARFINGMLLYTESGNMISSSAFAFFVAFKYAFTGPADRQETIAQQYLREELYYKDVEITESKPITIDGISGYEITARGIHSVSKSQDILYLVTLFAKDGAYTMLGSASEQFEDNLAMFKRVARTFHLKEKR
jgi:hypothetical protein